MLGDHNSQQSGSFTSLTGRLFSLGFMPKKLPYDILVLGYNGCGKTTLVMRVIKEDLTCDINSTKIVQKVPFRWEVGFTIYDTPAQLQYGEDFLNQAIAHVNTGRIGGIINVCCWGYNWRSKSEEPIFTDDLLEQNRENELRFIKTWGASIQKENDIRWIITAVNKADKFRDSISDVVGRYQSDKVMRDAIMQNLRSNVRLSFLPSASPPRDGGLIPVDWTNGIRRKFNTHLKSLIKDDVVNL